MRLIIEDKSKQEIFVAIFQLLKNWSSHIIMHFETERLYIQSMDKSHICLADIEINNKWFSSYDCSSNNNISVDSNQFAVLMNYALKHDSVELKFEDEVAPEKLYMNFLNEKEKKGSFDHFFELNLIDVEEDGLGIPDVEYDVEFTIDSKKLVDVLSELFIVGQDLNITCNDNIVELNSSGDSAKLKVNIPVSELNEYAISEEYVVSEGKNQGLNISFSLSHICKMCATVKLGAMINVSLSSEYPMSLQYNLGDESNVVFYIAPKVTE
jgi:proliferating cell nuclear antigen